MILVDTNIISEAMRPSGNPLVKAWLDRTSSELCLCAPVLAEIRAGIDRLPDGAKKRAFDAAYAEIEARTFVGPLIAFERAAAHRFGQILALRRAKGRPIGLIDAMIGATALANGMPIATRDVYDFDELGIELINPFDLA